MNGFSHPPLPLIAASLNRQAQGSYARMRAPHSVQQEIVLHLGTHKVCIFVNLGLPCTEFTGRNTVDSHSYGCTRIKLLQRSWGGGSGVHRRVGPQDLLSFFNQVTDCLDETIWLSFASYLWLFGKHFSGFLKTLGVFSLIAFKNFGFQCFGQFSSIYRISKPALFPDSAYHLWWNIYFRNHDLYISF